MAAPRKYPDELRERAVRLYLEEHCCIGGQGARRHLSAGRDSDGESEFGERGGEAMPGIGVDAESQQAAQTAVAHRTSALIAGPPRQTSERPARLPRSVRSIEWCDAGWANAPGCVPFAARRRVTSEGGSR